MQPPEPQFVRLSPHREQLRKSHATAFTRVDAAIHGHVIKREAAGPSVSSPAPRFPPLSLGFLGKRQTFAAVKVLSWL